MKKARKLYESPTGDRWYLIREPSGGLFVRHESPDGEIEHVEIGAFLSTGDGPEKHALLGAAPLPFAASRRAGRRPVKAIGPLFNQRLQVAPTRGPSEVRSGIRLGSRQ